MSVVEPEDAGKGRESGKEKGKGSEKENAIAVAVVALASFHMGEMRMLSPSHHLG